MSMMNVGGNRTLSRSTQVILAFAITFGSFSVYNALGGGTSTVGRTERSEVPAVADSVSGTALAAGVDVTVTNTNPLVSAMRRTNAPRPAVKTTLTPIEQIQVGDRVLAESPTGEEDTAFGSEIIPSDWRKLTLRAPKRDGTVAEVVLLRPLTWLNEQHGEVGGTVFISVPECGIDGNAEVLAIDPCPAILSGAGRVVTGTFLHQARSTITLTIAGQSEPIECTGNHPFWSEDRQTFVRADSLQPNETLRTATGLTTVESWTPELSSTPVYNIEVHGAHVYHVGTSGVVVHNPGGLPILNDCPWVPKNGHYAEWELRLPNGKVLKGDEINGVDFPLRGDRLSFPDQSWYGHTEGKIIDDLSSRGMLKPGTELNIDGMLPPCPQCQNIMEWASGAYGVDIRYVDISGNFWWFLDGKRHIP